MTTVLIHLLAAYVILLAPWWGRILYEKTQKRMQAGDALAKIRMYRFIVIEQAVSTLLVLCLWRFGGISAASLGLAAPRSWWLSAGLAIAVGGLFLWSGIRLRPKAQRMREKLKGRAEAILPTTFDEQRWFAAISVGAGISEELIFRGFLFYYFTLWFPHINHIENALLTSLIFGMGHLYQGWKGVVSTGIVGLMMAGLYVLTGNLLVPVVAHATADLRVLLIFWTGPERQETAAQAA
jgi:membrane protease YdiL (CAAX protease family)